MAKKTAPKKKAPAVKKVAVHYTEDYIINPTHPVTINLVGCGGTGSHVLNSLGRMHIALTQLGHPGLFVRAIDPKRVTRANPGRQMFSPVDVDEFKCVVLIGRTNRFFQTDWEAIPGLYSPIAGISPANFTISCVDTGKARTQVKKAINTPVKKRPYDLDNPYEVPFYWMDFGNMRDRGQVVIGTIKSITQPTKSEFTCRQKIPLIDELHPDIMIDRKGDDQGPSCSLAEALNRQDLFINDDLAKLGMSILWKMFREAHLTYHGLYLNLTTGIVTPIKIK